MKKMKNLIKTAVLPVIAALVCGCGDLGFDYDIPVNIELDADSEIVQIAAGVTNYTLTGKVTSPTGILEFVVYNANNRTGSTTSEIEGTRVLYGEDDRKLEHEFSVTLDNITQNRCVKIYARDSSGEYMKGFLVKVTANVVITDECTAETGDYFYGTFFASWYLGRVYPFREAETYAKEIDISFGELTDSGTGIKAAVMISPDKREENGMTAYKGARSTRFMLTDMTVEEYNAIGYINDSPLKGFDPANDYEVLFAGKVYAYRTADGKNGLIVINSIASGSDVKTIKFSAKVQN